MTERFQAGSLPLLIGSLPMGDHRAALDLVLEYTPEIPLWVQLPIFQEEGMVLQFIPGMPGAVRHEDGVLVDSSTADFEKDLLRFYETYMAVMDGQTDIDASPFAMTSETARGFFELLERAETLSPAPLAVKGQVTGPVTFGTSVKDQNGRAIFYDLQVRDAMVKLLALKARWQVRRLSAFRCPVIIFFDEPALAGFGSSEFISISKEEIADAFAEVIDAVHQEGGLAGVHVCANADWSLILESPADIVSFDAFAYFDRFVLYADLIKKFMDSGRTIALGIVPTLDPDLIEKESLESLMVLWEARAREMEKIGVDTRTFINQSFITPSCGTGALSLAHATKVLALTRAVSEQVRKKS